MSDELIVEEGDAGPAPEVTGGEVAPEAVDASQGFELPEDPEEAIAVLTGVASTATRDAAAHLDDLQRLAAEFENYRKRTERDRTEFTARAAERLIGSLLPVLDSFEQAFAHEAQSESEQALLSGVQATFHQLLDVLGGEGLAAIPAAGEPFDPAVHEAVGGGGASDLVVDTELRRGYRLGGKVIRPTLVTVAETPEPEGEEEG